MYSSPHLSSSADGTCRFVCDWFALALKNVVEVADVAVTVVVPVTVVAVNVVVVNVGRGPGQMACRADGVKRTVPKVTANCDI